MWSSVVKILSGSLGAVGNIVSGWQERKSLETKVKTEIAKAKVQSVIKIAETGQGADINWDNIMATNSKDSWKDEFWTIVLSIPMILTFIPGLSEHIHSGFIALNETPEWYKAAVGVAISASFGYRKYTDYIMKKEIKNK